MYFLIILTLLFSCTEHFEEKELYGYYSPVDYKNTFDTLHLQPKGIYYRKVYDGNKKLLLNTNGKWNVEKDGKVKLNGFFLNLDNDLVKYPETVNDDGMELLTNFETNSSVIQFCCGYKQGENCYQKIK